MKTAPFALLVVSLLSSTVCAVAQAKPETPTDSAPAPNQPAATLPGSDAATPYFPLRSRRQAGAATSALSPRGAGTRSMNRPGTGTNAAWPGNSLNPQGADATLPLDPALEPGEQPAASDSFTEGVLEEEGNMNLDAAMNSYQSIIAAFDKQRAQAANAMFRLGEVYRKMGRLPEAKIHYARVLREFPDQVELTRLSHQRLVADAAQTPMTQTGRASDPKFRQRLQQIVSGPGSPPKPDPTMGATQTEYVEVDPKLLERYGLLPPARQTQESGDSRSYVFKMDPKLLERYGLLRPGMLRPTSEQPAEASAGGTDLGRLPAHPDDTRQKELLQAEIKLVEESLQTAKKKVEVGAASPEDLISIERERLSLRRDVAALEGNRQQERDLLNADLELVMKQRETMEKKVANGKANPEDLIKSDREMLVLRRKLAALDQPQQYGSRTSAANRTRTVANPNTQNVIPVEARSDAALSDYNSALPRLSVASLSRERSDLDRRLGQVRGELTRAESELRQSMQLQATLRRSKPESLPPSVASDARYQELKKAYQDAVLSGGPESEVKQGLEKLTTWVQKIYLPELESLVQESEHGVEALRVELAQLERALAGILDRQRMEPEQYRKILNDLYTICQAKDQLARERRKQAGDSVPEDDIRAHLGAHMPKPIEGVTYEINPVGTPPSAKLSKPLGDLPAGHVIEIPTTPPRALP